MEYFSQDYNQVLHRDLMEYINFMTTSTKIILYVSIKSPYLLVLLVNSRNRPKSNFWLYEVCIADA